ncbi:hypothetical protein CUR178_06964 [Leishmania enriettii]|uniref:RRM domain-containing protein n=1 Tax=Leishmania enriettii TaxID=5663 RepID=A0A836KQB7_LEIEN|nr:hypothetical protein CUR178_06964 [Leishmania enriettii]
MVNPAAVVHVFLDDANKALSMEDVKEWLQIMNEVVDMKLQFDAATAKTCYYVEFRSPVAAQQAVQYLNGARLKNCVVTIESCVYSSVPETQGSPGSTGESVPTATAAPTQSGKRCRETAALPFNHLLPPDLQMDPLLAECLPDLEKVALYSADGFAMWHQLQEMQKEMVGVHSELDAISAEIANCDAELTQLLHANEGTSASGEVSFSHPPSLLRAHISALQAHHCLRNQRAIPLDAHTSSQVAAMLTDCFGPLSLCSEAITQYGFFLAVRFVFAADEELFMAAATASRPSEASKEKGQRRGAKWKSIVEGPDWRPVSNITAAHHLFPWVLDAHLQCALRALLA